MARRRLRTAAVSAVVALAACSSGDAAPVPEATVDVDGDTGDTGAGDAAPAEQRFPDIVGVDAAFDDGTWSFSVTVSSPYDSPERYADGWRVVGPDDTVYGVHTLTHDHAGEQPFTRRQSNVEIPDDVDEVTIEGRDLANGFGGTTFLVDLADARG